MQPKEFNDRKKYSKKRWRLLRFLSLFSISKYYNNRTLARLCITSSSKKSPLPESDQATWLSKSVPWPRALRSAPGGGVVLSSYPCPRLTSHSGRWQAATDSPSPQRLGCLVHTLHVKPHIRPDRSNSSHCLTSLGRGPRALKRAEQSCCDTCKCLHSLMYLPVRFHHGAAVKNNGRG